MDFTVSYAENLKRLDGLRPVDLETHMLLANMKALNLRPDSKEEPQPFCCPNINPHKHITLAEKKYETAFADFLLARGHHPDLVFAVDTQTNFGPRKHLKHYQVLHGKLHEVDEVLVPPGQKINAYKNFKCEVHNNFIGVNLKPSSGQVGNSHHVRAQTETSLFMPVIDRFLQVCGE